MSAICLALDTTDYGFARDLVEKTRQYIGMIKIGPEMWAVCGHACLELGVTYNIPIFLDLKLHDIPNTVSRTIKAIKDLAGFACEIRFLSVHTFGGSDMLKAAIEAAAGTPTKIAAVTLLTSLNRDDMRELEIKGVPGTRSVELALLAKEAGVESFIASPMHTALLRDYLDVDNFKSTIITPGIRSSSAPEDDQKRTKPVSAAVRDESDWLVIGRPITQSLDPAAAAREMFNQIVKTEASMAQQNKVQP